MRRLGLRVLRVLGLIWQGVVRKDRGIGGYNVCIGWRAGRFPFVRCTVYREVFDRQTLFCVVGVVVRKQQNRRREERKIEGPQIIDARCRGLAVVQQLQLVAAATLFAGTGKSQDDQEPFLSGFLSVWLYFLPAKNAVLLSLAIGVSPPPPPLLWAPRLLITAGGLMAVVVAAMVVTSSYHHMHVCKQWPRHGSHGWSSGAMAPHSRLAVHRLPAFDEALLLCRAPQRTRGASPVQCTAAGPQPPAALNELSAFGGGGDCQPRKPPRPVQPLPGTVLP